MKEQELKKSVFSRGEVPEGVVWVLYFFLTLASAESLGVILRFVLSPFGMDLPLNSQDYQGQSWFSLILNPLLGTGSFLAAYGLYKQKRWFFSLAMWMSRICVLYGAASAAAMLLLPFGLGIDRDDRKAAFALMSVYGVYGLAIATGAFFVIRYLKRSEIKQWFFEHTENNPLAPHDSNTQEN